MKSPKRLATAGAGGVRKGVKRVASPVSAKRRLGGIASSAISRKAGGTRQSAALRKSGVSASKIAVRRNAFLDSGEKGDLLRAFTASLRLMQTRRNFNFAKRCLVATDLLGYLSGSSFC